GTSFNFDFWQKCEPRRSTWPACRAVIAARRQGSRYDELMTRAIQEAYYLRAMNPSDEDTLVTLAGEIGLDQERFQKELQSPAVQEQLESEMQKGRAMGATSFPSLVLERDDGFRPVPVNYTDEEAMLEAIRKVTEG
ncbi:MAG: DsbA family protein, partial [Sedimenticolaceae bacterium]|nr:DsbA family protein [Sedimenticolaceae bacterium]